MEVVVRFTRPSNSEAGAIPLQARSNRSLNYNYNYHHSNGQGSYLIEASQQASYRADQGPGHLRQLLKFVN